MLELTRVEMVRGLRHPELNAGDSLMRALQWIAVDEEIARRASTLGRRLRRPHGIGTVALVIAATPQHLDAPLATSNVRRFAMFEDLEPPYSG